MSKVSILMSTMVIADILSATYYYLLPLPVIYIGLLVTIPLCFVVQYKIDHDINTKTSFNKEAAFVGMWSVYFTCLVLFVDLRLYIVFFLGIFILAGLL